MKFINHSSDTSTKLVKYSGHLASEAAKTAMGYRRGHATRLLLPARPISQDPRRVNLRPRGLDGRSQGRPILHKALPRLRGPRLRRVHCSGIEALLSDSIQGSNTVVPVFSPIHGSFITDKMLAWVGPVLHVANR